MCHTSLDCRAVQVFGFVFQKSLLRDKVFTISRDSIDNMIPELFPETPRAPALIFQSLYMFLFSGMDT